MIWTRPVLGAARQPRRTSATFRLSGLLLLGACALPGSQASPDASAPVFYPAPPLEPRIQLLATYVGERDVTGGPSAFERFVLGEREHAELGKPYGLALHDGQLLICDTRPSIVVVFDLAHRAVELLGEEATGRLRKPINIAVDPEGYRWVADTGHRRLMIYDPQGRYVRALGDPERWVPTDVVFFEDRAYVVDVENGRVVVLDRETGEELDRIGRKGSGRGELFFPTNIALDAEGNLYVADTGNARVLKFSRDGEPLQEFGGLGRGLGQLVRPKGVAVDREGRVYVADAAFENVQIFAPDGRLLLFFGTTGNVPGGLNLPADLLIDYENIDLFADRVADGYTLEYLIVVSSQFGRNKVNVYGFLSRGESGNEP
ncbi:MAG: 6-bladed beta-propeller [Myxococcota bacterium]